MNQLDLLLQNSLADLAAGFDLNDANATDPSQLEFGTVAFFKESSWRPFSWHRNAKDKTRASHPGLSTATNRNQVAFGSSKLEDRDPATTLFVTPAQCTILDRKTAFLLQYSAPLNIYDVDFRKTAIAKISPNLNKELKRKLVGV